MRIPIKKSNKLPTAFCFEINRQSKATERAFTLWLWFIINLFKTCM